MRGQAALEYIVTYGWTILIVIVIVGALAYFGLLSPGRWTAERCDFGAQLGCQDYFIEAEAPQNISLFLRNDYGKNITITGAWLLNATGGGEGSIASSVTIDPGAAEEVVINLAPQTPFSEGQKRRSRIRIQLRRALSGSPQHNITGLLYTTAQ